MTEKDKELISKARRASWEEILHMVDLADSDEAKAQLTAMLHRKFRKEEDRED